MQLCQHWRLHLYTRGICQAEQKCAPVDQKGQGIKQKESYDFCVFSSFKVNSWQHETEMTMVNITKKIAENLNETTSMFDEYTKSMEEERDTLNEKFSNWLNEETSAIKNENMELKEKLEELSKNMGEERVAWREEFSKNF